MIYFLRKAVSYYNLLLFLSILDVLFETKTALISRGKYFFFIKQIKCCSLFCSTMLLAGSWKENSGWVFRLHSRVKCTKRLKICRIVYPLFSLTHRANYKQVGQKTITIVTDACVLFVRLCLHSFFFVWGWPFMPLIALTTLYIDIVLYIPNNIYWRILE